MASQKGVIFALLRLRIGMNYLPLNFGIKVPDNIFDLIPTVVTDVKSCLITLKRRFLRPAASCDGRVERKISQKRQNEVQTRCFDSPDAHTNPTADRSK